MEDWPRTNWKQERFSAEAAYEEEWLNYAASFKYLSNWVKYRANPFGDPNFPNNEVFALGRGSKTLHDRWRRARSRGTCYSATPHPFCYQMGRVFTYQLLLEQSISLLRDGGRCGLIIPSGIYSDAWSGPLRNLLLDNCRWEWLFGFENREGVFPIHRSYKFNPVIVEKGDKTKMIRTAFMRRKSRTGNRQRCTPHPILEHRSNVSAPRVAPSWKSSRNEILECWRKYTLTLHC